MSYQRMESLSPKAERALLETIEIWERRARGLAPRKYVCPLCLASCRKGEDQECGDCPLMQRTDDGCYGTPWHDWADAAPGTLAEIYLAGKVLEFLKDTLRLGREAEAKKGRIDGQYTP